MIAGRKDVGARGFQCDGRRAACFAQLMGGGKKKKASAGQALHKGFGRECALIEGEGAMMKGKSEVRYCQLLALLFFAAVTC